MPNPAIFDSQNESIYRLQTSGPGPSGELPLEAEFQRSAPSGTLFGWTENAGMGWNPKTLGRSEFLILSTQGGICNGDGSPVALG